MAKLHKEIGAIIVNDKFSVVKKVAKKGDEIKKHNHEEAMVTFCVVKGKARVFINEEEFIVEQGQVLEFDGNDYISANILEDAEIVVHLVLKNPKISLL